MDISTGVDIVFGLLEVGMSAGTAIVKALPTHRQCTVHMVNKCSSYTLCNPSVHTRSGRCKIPFPPAIPPSESGDALFSKTANTACGSVGIFTCNLVNNCTQKATEKIAIMYKVPFDLNLKANAYAVGVFDINKECNRDLFHEMSKNTNTTFVRGKAKGPGLTHRSESVTVMATMSDCYTPVMRVQVTEN